MVATYRDKEPQQSNYLARIVKSLVTLTAACTAAFLTNGCYSAPKYSNEKHQMAMHAPADSIDSLISFRQDEQKPQASPEKSDSQDPPDDAPKPNADQETYLGTTPEEIALEKQAKALYDSATVSYENNNGKLDDSLKGKILEELSKSNILYRQAEEINEATAIYSAFIESTRKWIGTIAYGIDTSKEFTAEDNTKLDEFIAAYEAPKIPPQQTPPAEKPPAPAAETTPADVPKPEEPAVPILHQHPLRFNLLGDGARMWAEYTRASEQSSEIDRVDAGFTADYGDVGLDVLGHWHNNLSREAVSNDRVVDDGFGAYFNGRIWVLEASVAVGEGTRRRTSHEQNVTSDPNFIITDTTRAVETTDSSYNSGRAAIKIGNFKPALTLYEASDDINVNAQTIVDVVNLNDPAGNYTQIIDTDVSREVTTTGIQPMLEYDADETVLGRAKVGGLFGYELIEFDGGASKIEEYNVTAFADLRDKNDAWGLATAVGRRWADDSESNRRFDPVHGYVNAAADLEQLIGVPETTLFGSFWHHDEPGAGGGIVLGRNSVPMIMNYRNAVAWKNIDLMKQMAPEERNVYLRMMQHNLIRDLGADNELRLLLFAGANRNTVNGIQEWNLIGEAALNLPLIKDFPIAPFGRIENNGRYSSWEAGTYLGPVKFSAGQFEEEGVKHEKFPRLTVGFGTDF